MKEIIEQYLMPTFNDQNHRYKSWEHCYNAFSNFSDSQDYLTLNLAFYLASWGMYRGSSGLLWKDFKVHLDAVKIIKSHQNVRNKNLMELPKAEDVLQIVKELKQYYSKIKYFKGENQEGNISATDTLISKIILGTLGCLPAFDRFFIQGFFNKEYSIIDINNLQLIWQIAKERKLEIKSVQEWIKLKTGIYYPPMKVLDMYYWQLGYEYAQQKIKNNGK